MPSTFLEYPFPVTLKTVTDTLLFHAFYLSRISFPRDKKIDDQKKIGDGKKIGDRKKIEPPQFRNTNKL